MPLSAALIEAPSHEAHPSASAHAHPIDFDDEADPADLNTPMSPVAAPAAEGRARPSLPPVTLSDRDSAPLLPGTQEFRIFLYGIAKGFVDRVLERLNLHHIRVTKNIHDAHAVLILRGNARPGSKILQLAEDYQVPVFFAKTNTMPQIQRVLREAIETVSGTASPGFAPGFGNAEDDDEPVGAPSGYKAAPVVGAQRPGPTQPGPRPEPRSENRQEPRADRQGHEHFEDENELALREAHDAIQAVVNQGIPIELTPRRSYIRRLQHELVDQANLISFSVGDEPNRRLKLVPPKAKAAAE